MLSSVIVALNFPQDFSQATIFLVYGTRTGVIIQLHTMSMKINEAHCIIEIHQLTYEYIVES